MCEHGDTVSLMVPIPAGLAFDGVARWGAKPIDRCIVGIVAALNDVGVLTASSCCGHGRMPGSIVLQDGRTLMVLGPEAMCVRCGERPGIPKMYWGDGIVCEPCAVAVTTHV